MPILAAFFGSMMSWLSAKIAEYFTKRAAAYVSLVVTLAAAVAATWAILQGLVAGLGAALPGFMTAPATWVLPYNLDDCIAVIFGAEVAIAGYRWHKETVRASVAAT